MIHIIPSFLTLVRKSMNGIPPIIGTSTDSRGRKIGIMPSIAIMNKIAKYIAEKIPMLIRSLPFIITSY
jgi:hypothetical protein